MNGHTPEPPEVREEGHWEWNSQQSPVSGTFAHANKTEGRERKENTRHVEIGLFFSFAFSP